MRYMLFGVLPNENDTLVVRCLFISSYVMFCLSDGLSNKDEHVCDSSDCRIHS